MRILRFLGWYCALTMIAAVGMLIFAFPSHPKSSTGWLWFFVLALPITLIGEAIGEGLWRNPLAKRIEQKTSTHSFSWLRIAYGFVVMLLVFAAAWCAALLFGAEGRP